MIQNKLLPFIENVDYSIVNNELVALPKTRQVEQIIHHEAIAEVVGVPAHGIIPAEFDAQGNEISPAQPGQEEIIAVAAQEAYDEVILVDEEYFEAIPSMSEVKLSCIADMALAIEEYLSDKAELRDPENDSINIVDGRIFSWGFTNIPQPSVDELYGAYLVSEVKQAEILRVKTLKELGAKSRLACQNCLDIIAGFNLQRQLTAEQITAMQSSFSTIQTALMTSRPTSAKFLIEALTPDGVIVTEIMKSSILAELEEF
jgi:hypothetical protein